MTIGAGSSTLGGGEAGLVSPASPVPSAGRAWQLARSLKLAGNVALNAELFWFLALAPIIGGVTLIAVRPVLLGLVQEDSRVVLRIALIACSLTTAAALGFEVSVGLGTARTYLPDRGSDEAFLPVIGAVGLLFALAAALVMAAMAAVAARDALGIIKRR